MNKKAGIQSEKSCVALEICEESIKLTETNFFKREKPTLRFAHKRVSWKNSNISEEIRSILGTRGFSGDRVLLNIPRYLVMARVTRLPSVNDDEIKNMVRMEAVKQMPYRDEDIITGHRIIEKLSDGYSDVLMIVSQASTVKRFISIVNAAGLTVEKIALSSETLFFWHSFIRGLKDKRSNIALVNMDSEYIDMVIVEKGKLVFTRAFSYGFGETDTTEKVIDEIKRSIATYQKEREQNIERVILSGAGNRAQSLRASLSGGMNVPVESISQAEGVELAEKADQDLNDASFLGLIGLSLKKGSVMINLFPEEMVEDKEFRLFKKSLTKTLILFAAVIILLLGVVGQRVFAKYRILRSLNTQIKAIAPSVNKAKRMRADLKLIKNEIQKRPLAIEILSEIYRLTPRGISFNLVDYTSDKALVLRGGAPSLDSIIKFIKVLEGSEYFANVKLKYTTKRTEKRSQKTDFEIICYPEEKES